MNDYEIRSVVNLKYDSVVDKDIIEEIEDMTAHRKFGDYITNLIKFANENREALKEMGFYGYEKLATDKHAKDSLNNKAKLSEVKDQLDDLTKIVLEMKTAFCVGNMIGVEKQCDNVLLTEMYLQRQLNKLNMMLGNKSALTFIDSAVQNNTEALNSVVDNAAELVVERYATEINNLSKVMEQLSAMQITTSVAPVAPVERDLTPVDMTEENLRVAHTGFNDVNNNFSNTANKPEETSNNDGSAGLSDDADIAGIMDFLGL